jgi:hypothetical protein
MHGAHISHSGAKPHLSLKGFDRPRTRRLLKVEPAVLQTCDRNALICGNFRRDADPGTYRA